MAGPQGQAKWAKVAYKSSTYDVTHKKNRTTKQKIVFRVQTRRLAASFDASSRYVTCTGAEILPRKAMYV